MVEVLTEITKLKKREVGKKLQQSRKSEDQINDEFLVDTEALGANQAPIRNERTTPVEDGGQENGSDNGNGQGKGKGLEDQEKRELTQTERDVILAHVIKNWRFNLTSPEAKELTINGSVVVLHVECWHLRSMALITGALEEPCHSRNNP